MICLPGQAFCFPCVVMLDHGSCILFSICGNARPQLYEFLAFCFSCVVMLDHGHDLFTVWAKAKKPILWNHGLWARWITPNVLECSLLSPLRTRYNTSTPQSDILLSITEGRHIIALSYLITQHHPGDGTRTLWLGFVISLSRDISGVTWYWWESCDISGSHVILVGVTWY